MLTPSGKQSFKDERAKFIKDAAASTAHPDYSTPTDTARADALERNLTL
jgi:hypothetical protein